MLLLCGMLAFAPAALNAEPAAKKSTAKQKANADSDQDEDKPAKKPSIKKTKPKADADDEDDQDKPASKKTAAIEKKKKDEAAPPSAAHPAAVSSLNPSDIEGFSEYPKQVRSLVESSLALTHLGLTYNFGGSNPSEGGMDCSGTIYHVLKFQGLKDVPRQSDEMCAWVRDHSQLHLTSTAHSLGDDEFVGLRPGDLLFWTGTYKTDRKLPITHVMLYLGKLKKNGKPVVFGASDGRYYAGERRSGVSVFDLSLPKDGSEASLYGYGPPPGLRPSVSREELAKTEGEMIRPAIVVPRHAPEDAKSSAPSTKPSPTEVIAFNRPHTDEPLEPVIATTRSEDAKSSGPAPKPSPTEVIAFNRPHTDEPLEPVIATTRGEENKPDAAEKDDAPREAKKSAAVTNTRSTASAKNDDEDDKPAMTKRQTDDTPKAKSPVAKKPAASTTPRSSVAKKKPQPSAGRVAVDETTEALRRAGKSIRSVFD